MLDLRTIEDSVRIREAGGKGGRAVVVGMGFIGSEVAATLRQLGLDVVCIEPFAVPLERALGPEVGRAIAELHREHGVVARYGEGVDAFEGAGTVERVLTSSGERVECDFAVVGVGIEPAVEVVAGTGVEVDNGIVVDELCRTSVEGIWAAGDVARHHHPLFGLVRVEHWRNAIEQGAAAARSMLGKGVPYAEVHWFWSDQYDANIQYTGHHTGWDELVVRGSIDERKFVAFYLVQGVVHAAAALDSGRDLRRAPGADQDAVAGRSGGAARSRDRPADARAGRLSRRRRQPNGPDEIRPLQGMLDARSGAVERVENRPNILVHADVDRRVALRVAARLRLAQRHHEMQEVDRLLALERGHELLVVDPERVRRVVRDRTESCCRCQRAPSWRAGGPPATAHTTAAASRTGRRRGRGPRAARSAGAGASGRARSTSTRASPPRTSAASRASRRAAWR